MATDPLKSEENPSYSSAAMTPESQIAQVMVEFDETSSISNIMQFPDTRPAKSKLSVQENVDSQPQAKKRNVSRRNTSNNVTNAASNPKISSDPLDVSKKSIKFAEHDENSSLSRDARIIKLLNDGSEEENDEGSDSDDDRFEPLVPRGLRLFFQDDEDTPPNAETGDLLEEAPREEVQGPQLYSFDWREFPSPPISPYLRRETFTENVGPTIEPTSNPYEAFVKIWDRPIMEHIASQTNLNAQEYANHLLERGEIGPTSRIASWTDTNVDELYTCFALVIAMGIVVKTKLENYWSADKSIFATPGFSVNMSLKRFQLLSRCLHFNDNSSVSSNTLSCSIAKIFKIQPIVDHLNSKFSSLYRLGQNISLDESLSQWKGRLDIKQFIPNKAATVGIETYEVCDSRTGYLWRFELYTGGEGRAEPAPMSKAIPKLVLRLLRGLGNRGHTVWMDNYYNSPVLARVLKCLGFDCVGTLRTNRQYVPEQIANLKKSDMRIGELRGCTSGDVDLMVWRDRNRVAMISTYHGVDISADKPVVIKDYNVCMGGVDRKDQMIAMYPIERKRTQIWYKKTFRRLLNVSILNAYILHKHFTRNLQHRDFRMSGY